MGRLCSLVLFTLFACTSLCGCQGLIDALSGQGGESGDDSGAQSAVAAVYWDGPKVRTGVVLIIQVGTVSQPPTSMQVQVDQKGEITLPYLLQEPIQCNDLSLDDLKEKLVKAYQVYIKQPQVTVTFGAYDPRNGVSPWGYVNVMGEVAMPGPVNMPPTMDLTVTKVLQIAGGLRQFAKKNRIKVTSCDKDGNQKTTIVNLDEIGEKGLIYKDITLQAGDVVFVPTSWY